MAVQIYDRPGQWAQASKGLATGLGRGLEALAQYKMDEVLKNKQQSELSNLLRGANYDDNTSNLLAKLQQLDPQNFHKMLSMASGSQGGQTPFAQSAQQQKIQQWMQSPQADKIMGMANTYDDIITTGQNMLSQLDKGIQSGIVANIKGKYAPNWLNENSETFLKDAAHMLNLSTEGLKGAPSRLRINWQEAEKPGLQHSPQVNRKIIEHKIKEAMSKRDQLFGLHPQLKEFGLTNFGQQQPQQPQQQIQLQQAQQQMNPIQQILAQDPNASVERDPQTGDLYYNGQLIARAKRG